MNEELERSLLKIRQEVHEQAMEERMQRRIIGWILGTIVIVLPMYLLTWLWEFVDLLLPIVSESVKINGESGIWTFVTFMFSSTYIAVVALYGGLIAAVFQKFGGAKTDDLASGKRDKNKEDESDDY